MCFYSVGIVIYNIWGLSQELAKGTFSPSPLISMTIHSHSRSNFLSRKWKKLSAKSKLLSPCLGVFPFSKMHVHFLSVPRNTNIETVNPNYSYFSGQSNCEIHICVDISEQWNSTKKAFTSQIQIGKGRLTRNVCVM